ncbi:hypothetical protein [Komagataeibacter kakiaceti]|uniref:hypothetical protein n=1 Tax=Komagataeibacter kakiaceti TaxID=943261 RepID=UPI00131F4166|nr:hypothetical protein [Komagataeibacter kakiaceti]
MAEGRHKKTASPEYLVMPEGAVGRSGNRRSGICRTTGFHLVMIIIINIKKKNDACPARHVVDPGLKT